MVEREPQDYSALLIVVYEAASQVGHATLAARAGDAVLAQAHASNAQRALNVLSDELRFGAMEVGQ